MPSEPPPPPPAPGDDRWGAETGSTGGTPWTEGGGDHALPPPGADEPVGASGFAEPRRLHPASVLLGVPLGQAIQALIFPVVATLAAPLAVTIAVLLFIAIIGLVVRLLDWRMRSFSFDGEVLRVDHGVLSRNHRSLDVGRIQQVEIQRGAVQRLFGLAALRVETAGSATEPEVDLRVLPDADAVALRSAIRSSQDALAGRERDQNGDDRTEGEEILRVPNKHVVLAAVTGARLLVLPAVIGGALQFIGNQIGPFIDDAVDRMVELGLAGQRPTTDGLDWQIVAVGVLLALVLTVLAAIVVGVLRDGNFRIERVDEDLHVSRGLLSTRDSVVPLRRVQLVEIKRNWARRVLGFATVRIRSAGGSVSGDGRVSVPLLPLEDVDRLLGHVLPGVPGIPELTSHPRAALRRALFRWLRPALLVIGLAFGLPAIFPALDVALVEAAQPYTLLLLPLNTVLAVVEYRQLAHGRTELVVAARSGALSITTEVAPVVKVQAITHRRSFFQRRLGLTTLSIHVAGPGALVTVLDAGASAAAELYGELTAHAASPTPVLPATGRGSQLDPDALADDGDAAIVAPSLGG